MEVCGSLELAHHLRIMLTASYLPAAIAMPVFCRKRTWEFSYVLISRGVTRKSPSWRSRILLPNRMLINANTLRTEQTLKDFLGLNNHEYEIWMREGNDVIRDILYCRSHNLDLRNYSRGNYNEVDAR